MIITGGIATGPDGHHAERDPNQSFRTMYFIFSHSSDVFGGGGGNITPQVSYIIGKPLLRPNFEQR